MAGYYDAPLRFDPNAGARRDRPALALGRSGRLGTDLDQARNRFIRAVGTGSDLRCASKSLYVP